MKKIFLSLAIVAAMSACNSGKTDADSSTAAADTATEQAETQQTVALEQAPALSEEETQVISDEIRGELTAYYSGQMLPDNFSSQALNKAVDDANAKAMANGDEVGFFDFDIFSFEQDYCKGCGITSIEVLTPETTKATIHLSAPSNDLRDVELTMIKENGKWVADDVQWLPVSTYPKSVRAQVAEFLNQ